MGNAPPAPCHTKHHTVFYIENRRYLDAFYNCDNGLHTAESLNKHRFWVKEQQPKVCTKEEYVRIVNEAMNILGGDPKSQDLKTPDMFTYPLLYSDYNTTDDDWKVRKLADLQSKLRIKVRREYIYEPMFYNNNSGHYVHIISIKRRK